MAKTVITYGTFDLFHIGHLRLLQRAKALGDKLIVAVSTDKFNKTKGKKTIIPYKQRVEIVANIKCVDLVIPEKSWEQKISDIKNYNVDIFVMGEDWKGKFDFLKENCEVIYLHRTKGVSTTQLKSTIQNLFQIKPGSLEEAMSILEQIFKNFK